MLQRVVSQGRLNGTLASRYYWLPPMLHSVVTLAI